MHSKPQSYQWYSFATFKVNLRHGVPPNESVVTSTAVATTHMLEFYLLSRLTQNSTYEVMVASSRSSAASSVSVGSDNVLSWCSC